MGKASKEMIDLLTGFLVCEIGGKAIDGITYAMVLKDERDSEAYNRYMQVRQEADACGFTRDEVFRVYELCNGYVFDMDLSVAKRITTKLAKAVEKSRGVNVGNGDLIGNSPETRRKQDMIALAKYVQQEYDSGKRVVEAALFSRNSVPHIIISGKDASGKLVSMKFNAYAIRHWDIETINYQLLIPAGIRISKLEPCEILPSKTGVKFNIYIEPCTV